MIMWVLWEDSATRMPPRPAPGYMGIGHHARSHPTPFWPRQCRQVLGCDWIPLVEGRTANWVPVSLLIESYKLKAESSGDLQDGGGVRRGDHLPCHKYIKNTSTCGTTPTEHQLNAGRRPQISQKARNPPRTWPCV